MNFDELYEKYKNNTATEEEKAYVEAEIEKAKRLAAILDEQDAKRVIAPTEEETVKRSVKGFLRHTKLRVAAIVTVSVVLLCALLVGGFFATVAVIASGNSKYDRGEAVELAKKWIADSHTGVSVSDIRVGEVDRDLAMHHGFTRAYFEYDIEIHYKGDEYEFWVDAASGEVRLVDRD